MPWVCTPVLPEGHGCRKKAAASAEDRKQLCTSERAVLAGKVRGGSLVYLSAAAAVPLLRAIIPDRAAVLPKGCGHNQAGWQGSGHSTAQNPSSVRQLLVMPSAPPDAPARMQAFFSLQRDVPRLRSPTGPMFLMAPLVGLHIYKEAVLCLSQDMIYKE